VTRIAVIDHGAGNLVSIAQGLEAAGARVAVIESPERLDGADGIVLPGVGSATAAHRRLAATGMLETLGATSRPLLGICVGFQLLFDGSDEGAGGGLGRIPGWVRRLDAAPRLPHIGWNDITVHRPDPLLAGIPSGELFYFVHSYAPVPDDADTVIASVEYGRRFAAASRRKTAVGVQFHPERSGPAGRRILSNFVADCAGNADAA
jgi:glutamine amidotransferase